jgi:hypothetical protein
MAIKERRSTPKITCIAGKNGSIFLPKECAGKLAKIIHGDDGTITIKIINRNRTY